MYFCLRNIGNFKKYRQLPMGKLPRKEIKSRQLVVSCLIQETSCLDDYLRFVKVAY